MLHHAHSTRRADFRHSPQSQTNRSVTVEADIQKERCRRFILRGRMAAPNPTETFLTGTVSDKMALFVMGKFSDLPKIQRY